MKEHQDEDHETKHDAAPPCEGAWAALLAYTRAVEAEGQSMPGLIVLDLAER